MPPTIDRRPSTRVASRVVVAIAGRDGFANPAKEPGRSAFVFSVAPTHPLAAMPAPIPPARLRR